MRGRAIASTTLTAKGQVTIPKEIRDHFKLKTGDRLDVISAGGRIVIVPPTLHVRDLAGLLPRPERIATIAEMNAAVRSRSAGVREPGAKKTR